MRAMKTIVLMCLCGVASVAPAKDSLKARLKAHAEQAVMAMLPTNAVNEAAGFFGPVTKKYLPVFEKFQAEYKSATNKVSVVEQYLPRRTPRRRRGISRCLTSSFRRSTWPSSRSGRR